jgi:uncharacterized membrane protein
MFGSEFHGWCIFPLLMIILCIFMCVFMMKGRMGAMMCRPGSRNKDSHREDTSASAALNGRHAQGENNKEKLKIKEVL